MSLKPFLFLSLSGDLNPRPANYESAALPTELKRRLTNAETQNFASLHLLVGMRRLELPTPTSRTWCASQLRYIPIIDINADKERYPGSFQDQPGRKSTKYF